MAPALSNELINELRSNISKEATLLLPNDETFEDHTARWTAYQPPVFSACVVAGNEEDVRRTILSAKANDIPFMVTTARHGDFGSMANIQGGIQINLRNLSKVEISEDGNHVTVGAGIIGKDLRGKLFEAGKVTVTGVCEMVGIGFWLGGGHGILQGEFGLGCDQLVEAKVVLGNGEIKTVSETSEPELFWGMRGAGFNYGVVTEMKLKIYDSKPYETWTHAAYLYSHDQVEVVFETLNSMTANQRSTDHYFVIYKKLPEFDPDNLTVIVMVFSAGDENSTHLNKFAAPLQDIPSLGSRKGTFVYPEHSKLMDTDENSYTCQKGPSFQRYPIDVETNDVDACRKCYDIFNQGMKDEPELHESQMIFEGYPCHGVQAVAPETTAYPWRKDRILNSPFLTYEPNPKLDPRVSELGRQMRKVLYEGTGKDEVHVYVNYASGEESLESLYGYEPWRLEKLRKLKATYDPENLFGYNAGIV